MRVEAVVSALVRQLNDLVARDVISPASLHDQDLQRHSMVHSLVLSGLAVVLNRYHKTVGIERRLSFHDGEVELPTHLATMPLDGRAASFVADAVVLADDLDRPVLVVEYESFNSSDERVVLKDLLHASGALAIYTTIREFLVIVTLPDKGSGSGFKNYWWFSDEQTIDSAASVAERNKQRAVARWLNKHFPEKTRENLRNRGLRSLYKPFYLRMIRQIPAGWRHRIRIANIFAAGNKIGSEFWW